MTTLSPDTRKWLGLCALAEASAATADGPKADLLEAAGRLTTVAPKAGYEAAVSALTTGLRWACNAYALATTVERQELAPGLIALAGVVRARLAPPTLPREAAASLPAPPPPEVIEAMAGPREARAPRKDAFG